MGIKGSFVQYKFVLPKNTKHSSYSYQKLFRAIYGYTQNVTKSNGKTYKYHRSGLLSDVPYIHTGKNAVVLPQQAVPRLIEFFKTGKNPTHKWRWRGDWKVTYILDEKEVEEGPAISAVEEALERNHIDDESNQTKNIYNTLIDSASKPKSGDQTYIISKAQTIVENDWFEACQKLSNKLSEFYSAYTQLKNSR